MFLMKIIAKYMIFITQIDIILCVYKVAVTHPGNGIGGQFEFQLCPV